MFAGMNEEQIPAALEALLFVTDEPVGAMELAEMLELDLPTVTNTLACLQERFENENRGIQLREVAGGWRLYTHPAYHELIEKYVISWDTRKLSQAALETLAIVAYCQPITRAGVASVRGVNSDSSINSLVEKGLLREAGTADAPGNPMRYATTRSFLERFGLRTVADLPDIAQFAPDDETRALIYERLGASIDVAQQQEALENEPVVLPDIRTAQLQFVDEDTQDIQTSPSDSESPLSKELLSSVLSQSFGLTEKIDLSSLHFEDEDE